jgi:RNA polymerase sigma-70 factor, ECF subfamily
MADEPSATELEIRRLAEAGEHDAALTLTVESYGAELYGFLSGLSGDVDRAGDAFSATCERIWKFLPGFRWDGSFRAWIYRIARNEFLRLAAQARTFVPLSQVPDATAAVILRVRTTTPVFMRTETKEMFTKIREGLDPEDHMILGLRLDRDLSWNEIATVLGSEPEERARDAARLRKRFERLKERLRELAGKG